MPTTCADDKGRCTHDINGIQVNKIENVVHDQDSKAVGDLFTMNDSIRFQQVNGQCDGADVKNMSRNEGM